MSKELILRKLEYGDLPYLPEIYNSCFNTSLDESYFNWKYYKNPCGEIIAFIAFDPINNALGSFYGVIPESYMINGKQETIYQSMDTMTHPNYRNRGLFVKLAKLTYEYVYQHVKTPLLLGIPGTSSFHGFVNKLDWANNFNSKYLFSNTRVLNILGVFKKRYHITLTSVFNNLNNIDSLFYLQYKHEISKLITPNILKWKVVENPITKYDILTANIKGKQIALIIITEEDNKIKIQLLKYDEPNSSKYHLDIMKELLVLKSKKIIYTWNSPHAEDNKLYLKTWFLYNPFKKGPFSYRIPFITLGKKDHPLFNKWNKITSFDICPFIQD